MASLRSPWRSTHKNPRILITRLSHLGDCILTLPMFHALRSHYPAAFIAWVIESPGTTVLEAVEGIDQIIPVLPGFRSKPRELLRIARCLRRQRFDITVDPQSLNKSSLLAWLSGASLRIGHAGPRGRERSKWFNNRLVECPSPHLVDHSLELLRPLGIDTRDTRFGLTLPETAELGAESLLTSAHLADRDFIVINAGASVIARKWPEERFGQLASWLARQYQLPSLVVWHTEREETWARRIVEVAGAGARLAPRTSFLQLGAILKRSRLYVGADTGPTHMAVAVGTPCVSLHGATRREQSGAYGPAHRPLQVRYQPVSASRDPHDNAAMREISVEMVSRACSDILDRFETTRKRSA